MPARKPRTIIYKDLDDFIIHFNKAQNCNAFSISNLVYAKIAGFATLNDLCDTYALLVTEHPDFNAEFITANLLFQIYSACLEELNRPGSNPRKVKDFLSEFHESATAVHEMNTILKRISSYSYDDVRNVYKKVEHKLSSMTHSSKPTNGPSLYMGKPAKHNRAHPYNANKENRVLRPLVSFS